MILEKPGIIWKDVLDDAGKPTGEKKDASHIDALGILHSASASMMQNFDKRTPFGCPSKFWFAEVAAIPTPQTPAMEIGDACHKEVEHYLIHKQDAFGKIVRPAKPMIDALVAKYPVYQVEQWIPFGFKVEGINIRGRLDFIGRRLGDGNIANITDWKTTSSFEQYAKTPYQLRKDNQMLLYRAAAEKMGCDETLDMAHGYFQTKGKAHAEMVHTTINRQQLSEGMDDIINTLLAMKTVSGILDSAAVEKDPRKCNAGKSYQCPYYEKCQPTNKEGSAVTSLFAKYKSAAPAAVPATAPVVNTPAAPHPPTTQASGSMFAKRAKVQIEDKSTPDSTPGETQVQALERQIAELKAKQAAGNTQEAAKAAGVLPPDAPASDPALAADPVPDFEPIPRADRTLPPTQPAASTTSTPAAEPKQVVEVLGGAPKSKGGRPPGAKNKKTTGAHVEGAGEVIEESDFEIIQVDLGHGATLKAKDDPKSYEMFRIDVKMAARVRPGADIAEVRKALSEMVQRALYDECCVYKPESA